MADSSLTSVSRWLPWRMLSLASIAQLAVSVFLFTPALLIPIWHRGSHLSLARAGLLAAIPNIGMVVALIPWGAAADRFGERRVLVGGLVLTSLVALATVTTTSFVVLGMLLLVGGVTSASANAASGRVVVGWFPTNQRGLAMGIRQIAQPVGVFVAAVTVPMVAEKFGTRWALAVPLGVCSFAAVVCIFGLVNPHRHETESDGTALNPYRRSSFLWRVHASSALLVVPQFTLSVFGLLWLTSQRHWSTYAASILVGTSQLIGSAGRIAVGVLSDRVGSRVQLLRAVAVASGVSMVLLALLDQVHWGVVAIVYVLAVTISVADNGLAFTAVAEVAGPRWAGRALGAQNIGQFVAAPAVGPVMGAMIANVGYGWTFAAAAGCAVMAVPFVPRHDLPEDAKRSATASLQYPER